MEYKISCPHCSTSLQADETLLGRTVKCYKCLHTFVAAVAAEPKTKKCPYCGEVILAVAKKCKHCGEFLDAANQSARMEEGMQRVPAGERALIGAAVGMGLGILLILGGCDGAREAIGKGGESASSAWVIIILASAPFGIIGAVVGWAFGRAK